MRILLIEDDISTKRNLELMLIREGFNVYSTELGEDGIGLGKYYNYDLIILDLKLPDMHGYEVLQKMRNFRINTPVLILSGTLGAENKARGLMCGADDYITKPFEKVELIARIHTIIRRSHGYSNSVIETGKLCVNLMTKVVEVEGVPLHLTKKEYAILELLSLRKGTLITKEMFLNHLYGGLHEPGPKIIDVVICKLRKKIAKATGGEKIIQTDWGRGYILRNPH